MVWDRSLTRLAEEFGITGHDMANFCKRLNVPYPPRGHWAKKEAGKPVVQPALSPGPDGAPSAIDIRAKLPKPDRSPQVDKSVTTAAQHVPDFTKPEEDHRLHPRVQAWITDHKKRQRERQLEKLARGRGINWGPALVPDLTERYLYRFRATSAIFQAVERAGGRIETSLPSGKVTFVVDGHHLECSIVEKMVQSLKQRDEQYKWTALSQYSKYGLESSGFLRVGIITYLNGRRHEWVETKKVKIGQLMSTIVGAILAAGPILEDMKRDREEQSRRFRQEETRRYEAQRLRELEGKRWTKFREYAADWDERTKLLRFLKEIENRLHTEGDLIISDRPASAWVEWAKAKIELLDPFGSGATGLLDAIASLR
ncbi:hypothetical protein [Bradyrhizobium sp. SRS-191]|uniref:hypothetical protein n=1 Tax=Bradyrhizobium sp. SRS-191 TaxID=2962606 RepID=UPI00211DECA4|nr:hypothetical protein [Bradyrhizobium sp. SRS-191]